MAITANNVQGTSANGSDTLSFAYTPSSVTNPVLVCCFGWRNSGVTDLSATPQFGGVDLDVGPYATGGSDGTSQTFYMAAPGTSSLNITADWDSTVNWALLVYTLENVDQGSPLAGSAADNDFNNTPTLAVSSATGEYVTDALVFANAGATESQTLIGSETPNTCDIYSQIAAGAATVDMDWSLSASKVWAMTACRWTEDAGGGGGGGVPNKIEMPYRNAVQRSNLW